MYYPNTKFFSLSSKCETEPRGSGENSIRDENGKGAFFTLPFIATNKQQPQDKGVFVTGWSYVRTAPAASAIGSVKHGPGCASSRGAGDMPLRPGEPRTQLPFHPSSELLGMRSARPAPTSAACRSPQLLAAPISARSVRALH